MLGHTEYDDYGRDIVCSSASSIMITTINAIMMFDKNYITYEEKKDNFIIVINKNKYKAKITLDLPCGDIVENGTANYEKSDMKDIIFKREK